MTPDPLVCAELTPEFAWCLFVLHGRGIKWELQESGDEVWIHFKGDSADAAEIDRIAREHDEDLLKLRGIKVRDRIHETRIHP